MELPIKLGLISLTIFLFVASFGWIFFPKIIEYNIKKGMSLGPETDVRKLWEKLPFPITCKLYIFNVTNPTEVQEGGKAMLDEIGPFVYDEWREKINVVDNEDEDTVAFNPVIRWTFNKNKTGKLTGDELVTIPHPMITSILLTVAEESPEMLSLAYRAINAVFKDPTSIFVTARARDILFDGIYIDCSTRDFFGHTACNKMRSGKFLIPVGETGFMFSFFGFRNGTANPRMKVNRGVVDNSLVNRVLEYENKTEMTVWPEQECNQFAGTEGSIFSPLKPEMSPLLTFSTLFCRPMELHWVESSSYHGIPVGLYTTTLSEHSMSSRDKCYCPSESTCLKRGAMSMRTCVGSPMVASFPHFYDADNSYLEMVRGLRPDVNKHRMLLYFNSLTGTPVKARTVLQFNNHMKALEEVDIMQNLTEAFLPTFWVEETIEIPADKLSVIENMIYKLIYINDVVKWTVSTFALFGLLCSVYMYMQRKKSFSLSTMFLTTATNEIKEPQKSTIISTLSGMNMKETNTK